MLGFSSQGDTNGNSFKDNKVVNDKLSATNGQQTQQRKGIQTLADGELIVKYTWYMSLILGTLHNIQI